MGCNYHVYHQSGCLWYVVLLVEFAHVCHPVHQWAVAIYWHSLHYICQRSLHQCLCWLDVPGFHCNQQMSWNAATCLDWEVLVWSQWPLCHRLHMDVCPCPGFTWSHWGKMYYTLNQMLWLILNCYRYLANLVITAELENVIFWKLLSGLWIPTRSVME